MTKEELEFIEKNIRLNTEDNGTIRIMKIYTDVGFIKGDVTLGILGNIAHIAGNVQSIKGNVTGGIIGTINMVSGDINVLEGNVATSVTPKKDKLK